MVAVRSLNSHLRNKPCRTNLQDTLSSVTGNWSWTIASVVWAFVHPPHHTRSKGTCQLAGMWPAAPASHVVEAIMVSGMWWLPSVPFRSHILKTHWSCVVGVSAVFCWFEHKLVFKQTSSFSKMMKSCYSLLLQGLTQMYVHTFLFWFLFVSHQEFEFSLLHCTVGHRKTR